MVYLKGIEPVPPPTYTITLMFTTTTTQSTISDVTTIKLIYYILKWLSLHTFSLKKIIIYKIKKLKLSEYFSSFDNINYVFI